ncbi:hypothetical protein F503_05902 [Ophiostoma piceae UAMH 11346]|uniref:Uncharacterized protein n=1 Tax=Ophiostoma piceae (strain UAMH 11346) TaxID=1262450 RepID=S3CD15_OPHP1|nr:hypothetical protein F503_05902 [Ophiostoma piceae UAMH 11346]
MHPSLFTTAIATLAASATAAMARSHAGEPKPPVATFLYAVNLTSSAPLELGPSFAGNRSVQPIVSGTFAGPKLNGNITVGLDWGILDPKGHFSPDAIYVLNTHDGAHILVREHGHSPSVQVLFETGSDKYSWLNQVVGYANGGPNSEGVVQLNVWQLSPAA